METNILNETDVRKDINTRLENLGWKFNGNDRNVFLESPKTKEEKKKLDRLRPDYVLYSNDYANDKPLIIIEVKKPGGDLNQAMLQGIEYAERLEAPIVYATDGVFCKTLHSKLKKPLKINEDEVYEFLREVTALQYIKTNEYSTLPPKVIQSRQELITIFQEANNMLRVEGLRAGIERFSEFSNILFLKLLSENEYQRKEKGEKPRIPKEFLWNNFKNKSENEILYHINKILIPELEGIYNDRNLFTSLEIQNGNTLKKIIDKLDPLILQDINSDIKGDAFEYFLAKSTVTGNDLGEYFTPRHIVRMMVSLVNPRITEKVYDPFCGTGGMLIKSFRHIEEATPKNEELTSMLRKNTIFGNEITKTARITKMNMILAGDGHSNIDMQNSLANPKNELYDIVLTNMPYSQRTEHGEKYFLPTNNADSVNVQHCYKALKYGGRMALVVPEGFMFRKDLKNIRQFLVEKCHINSIVSLPQGVFLPYTGVKTNIIYATKKFENELQKQKQIWYFQVKNDGYTLDNHRRKREGDNDVDIMLAYRDVDRQQQTQLMNIGFINLNVNEVEKNDYNLVGARYKKLVPLTSSDFDFVSIKDVCTFVRGVTFSKSDQLFEENENTIRVASTKACQEYGLIDKDMYIINSDLVKDNEKILRNNDILISLANSLDLVGRVTFVKDIAHKTSFGAFMGLIRPNTTVVVPKYLYYLLKSEPAKHFFYNFANTTTNISNLTFATISEMKFPLPPFEFQQKVVDELDKYENIINGAKQIIENYKPFINTESIDNMIKITEVIDFISGLTLSIPDAQSENGIKIISMQEVKEDGTLDVSEIRKVDVSNKKTIPILQKGDLLFNWRNGSHHLVGKTVLFDLEGDFTFASFLLGIRIKDINVLNPKYLWCLLNQFRREGIYLQKMRMQVNGLFNRDELADIEIPMPTIDIQNKIVEELNQVEELILSNKKLIDLYTIKLEQKLTELWGEKL